MTIEKPTTLRISKRLRDELAKLGSHDDTFDTIIWRLLENSKEAVKSAEEA